MIVLPHTLERQASVQVHNGTAGFTILSDMTDPVFVWDPSIQHHVIANCGIQECFHSHLPGAHFLDKYNYVPNPLLQKVSIGDNETKCKRGFGT
jgi:hypothetical protein